MATGLNIGNRSARMGGLSSQARPPTDTNSSVARDLPSQNTGGTTVLFVALPIIQLAPANNTRYTEDALQVSNFAVQNASYMDQAGISTIRPEIVGIVDFEPIYQGQTTNPTVVGKLLDVQLQARALKEENLATILQRIRESVPAQEAFRNLEASFTNELPVTQSRLNLIFRAIAELSNARSAFDIKDTAVATNRFLSVTDFFINELSFSRQGFLKFPDTKILEQLLHELFISTAHYPTSLVSNFQYAYQNDLSPTVLNKVANDPTNFSVNVKTFRSELVPFNAANPIKFASLMDALPRDPDEKIKFLTLLLSKELRVSKGLGTPAIASRLATQFDCGNTGDPFNNIIGFPGATIFDIPEGAKSFSSVFIANTPDNNRFILPFEAKYIDDPVSHRQFVPGPSYFVDSLTNNVSALGIGNSPLINYINAFSNKFNAVQQSYNDLLGLNVDRNLLFANDMFSRLLLGFYSSTSGLTTDTPAMDLDQVVIATIFKTANTDRELKLLLLQFFILILGCDDSVSPQRSLYDHMAANEISILGNLTAVPTRPGFPAGTSMADLRSTALVSLANELSGKIEDRLFALFGIPSYQDNLGLASLLPRTNSQPDNGSVIGTSRSIENIQNELLGIRGFNIARGNVRDILSRSIFDGSDSSTNIFRSMVHYISDLTSSAGDACYLTDGTFRTRFNFISTSNLCLIVLELFTSFAGKYFLADFNPSTYQNILRLTLQTVRQTRMRNVYWSVGEIENSTFNNTIQASQRPTGNIVVNFNESTVGATLESNPLPILQQSLNLVKNAIQDENQFIKNILYVFQSINTRLVQTRDQILNFFNSNNVFLQAIFNSNVINSEAQVRLAAYLYDQFNQRLTQNRASSHYSPFLDNFSGLSTGVQSTLKALLQQSTYREKDTNSAIKLFTVGIPNGFSKNLHQRIDLGDVNYYSFTEQASTLVKVNLYKRSLDYPDLAFKPKEYIFDLALFVKNIPVTTGDFSTFVYDNVLFSDFSLLGDVKSGTARTLLRSGKYSFLTEAQKNSLANNHLQNDVLNFYTQILTGIDMSESTFLTADPPVEVDAQFQRNLQQFVKTFIQNFSTQTLTTNILRTHNEEIARLLSQLDANSLTENSLRVQPGPQGTVEITPELLEFLQLFTGKSFLSGHKITSQRWLTPKLFDRVFTFSADVDEFEIDHALTTTTQSGRQLFGRNDFQQKLVTLPSGSYIMKRKRSNEIRFDDYFVAVELMAPGSFT